MTEQTQAQLQILAFLGTVAVVGGGVLASVAFMLAGRRRHAALAATGVGAVVAGYVAALLTLGATARERVLGPGEAKVFCEIDCHLAYAVSAVRVSPAPAADAEHYAVTVRTTFDARTIAPWRGDGLLYPNPRRLRVVDVRGHAWTPLTRGGTPLSTPLRPGESYESTFSFDLPRDVVSPRLELTEADPVTRLIVGHENSPLHGKTLLALGRGFVSPTAVR